VLTSAYIGEDGSISRIGEMSLTAVSKISVGYTRQYNCLVRDGGGVGVGGGESGRLDARYS
jgi:hypothetical protein